METAAVLHVPALLASVSHEASEDFLLPEYPETFDIQHRFLFLV